VTAKSVREFTTPGRTRDQEVKGLYLQVTKVGNRSWVLRYTSPTTGRERWLGLGAVDDVPVALAREKARAARAQLGLAPTR
jgi:hypothetical protein